MALVLFGRRRGKDGTSGQSRVEEEGRQAGGHRVHDAYAFRRHREMCGAGTFEHCAVGRGSDLQSSQGRDGAVGGYVRDGSDWPVGQRMRLQSTSRVVVGKGARSVLHAAWLRVVVEVAEWRGFSRRDGHFICVAAEAGAGV